MDKPLSQITFDFSSEPVKREEPKEFLSGQPVPHAKTAPPKSTRGRKALKDIEAEAEFIEVPEDEILFQKQYYSIGEVASMFKVNTSLIRFWENYAKKFSHPNQTGRTKKSFNASERF